MKKHRIIRTTAALAVVLTAIYCHYSLEAEDWVVFSPRLPEAFDGTRILLLSDLHGASFGEGQQRLLQAAQDSQPDLIAISGDLADERTDIGELEPLIRGLCAIGPVYFVPGNHEWGRTDTEELLVTLEGWGVKPLLGSYVLLERQGQQLVLAGADDPFARQRHTTPGILLEQIRQTVPNDPYIVVLYHRNNYLQLWSDLQADLVLSGHGHGGVIRLPLAGGLLSVERRLFPQDEEGLYMRGRTTLAVSRGLGGLRLWNRPHLPTVVLRCDRTDP